MTNFLLDANSLLSKWGFGDGDALDDWWWDEYNGPPTFNDDDVLYELVTTHLLPAIEAAGHAVEIERIITIHNPVRAATLDGKEVDCYSLDGPELPVSVHVTPEQIHAAVIRAQLTQQEDGK